MNHQIEDDAHIRTALFERREAMRFDETRRRETTCRRHDRGIESLEVPDLKHAAARLGDRDEVLRLRDGGRDRLLDEHMDAPVKQRPADGMVQRRRGGDAHRVHSIQELAKIRNARHAEFGSDPRARLCVDVDHRDQLRRRQLGVFLRVKSPEVADANDGGA